jgi:GT2 family glycosyltransferase
MTMRRALFERLGPFDEAFGPGSRVGSGDDTDYIFRAYSAGVLIEYVPDMTVFHHHGRRTAESAAAVMRRYAIGHGGLCAKHASIDPFLCRKVYTNLRSRKAVVCYVIGAWRYFFGRYGTSARRAKDQRLQAIGAPAASR